ncbi:MAG TPA: tRNA (adenosine(37)-N6)-threonylcarbamoyltransferase complex dimerization subunit type 1 TsaB [Myxococcales bacterium]|nr:tRNA (adenosine(37)-N6)-threonylcarbamoyltransferase complex dimerization subunit type 1 TsaB [Myxococcales bacterium]
MRILALDTSTPVTSCALLDGESVVRQQLVEPPARAGDVLPGALGELDGVEAIAVGLGPGSFTGLRVGLAAAKAIAWACRLPLAGASSLQAIAFGEPGLVHAATEARKGELFVQPFRDGEPQGPIEVVMAAGLRLPPGARLLRTPPSAVAIGKLCLPLLRGAVYDAAACFSLAPDYVQGFPARGG